MRFRTRFRVARSADGDEPYGPIGTRYRIRGNKQPVFGAHGNIYKYRVVGTARTARGTPVGRSALLE